MTEQLRFQQPLRQSRTIHGHERALRPGRQVVNGVSHELLSRPGLAEQEHGGIGRGDTVNGLEELQHRRGFADHPPGRIRSQAVRLRTAFEQLGNALAEQVRIHGLGQEIVGTELECIDCGGDRSEPADHQDRNSLTASAQNLDQPQPIDTRHPKVQQ